jgi:hypothetical protein
VLARRYLGVRDSPVCDHRGTQEASCGEVLYCANKTTGRVVVAARIWKLISLPLERLCAPPILTLALPSFRFLPMADSPPPPNSSRLSTPTLLPLPGLRQLSEVSEPEPEPELAEHEPRLTIAIDAPPTPSGEQDDNKNKNEDKKISPG